MEQNMNTGVFELTSNNDYIYIQGTEENDIELLSLKGNTEHNTNSCTCDRFREGLNSQLYFYTGDYYNKYVKFYGTRFIYDSQEDIHEELIIKQNTYGGLYTTLPAVLKNQDDITIKIRINENTLESTDTFKLQFINANWDIRSLSPGEYTYSVKMSVQTTSYWLVYSHNRPEFLNIKIKNTTAIKKKFDFEILEIILNDQEGVSNNDSEFQTLNINAITVQESTLEKLDEYRLSNDLASRLNIINKKIFDIQKILV